MHHRGPQTKKEQQQQQQQEEEERKHVRMATVWIKQLGTDHQLLL